LSTYVLKDGRTEGPFEDQEVVGRINEGIFSRADLGWREGMKDWVALGTLYPEHAHKLHLKEMPPQTPHIAPEDPQDPNSHLQKFIGEQMSAGKHMPDVVHKLIEMGVDEDLARTLTLKVFSEHDKR
jgi:hypothetical protein